MIPQREIFPRRSAAKTVARAMLLLLLLLPAARPAAAQTTEPEEGTLVESAVTEIVLIEVYVSDRKGRAVRDIGLDEIIFKVDRRKQPIASFDWVEFVPAVPRPAPDGGEAPPPSPPDLPARSDAAGGEPAENVLPRHFLLFFEDATSGPFGMAQARRAAIDFVETGLSPSDLVSVVTYDNARKLEVLTDFTADRQVVRDTIRRSLEDRTRMSTFAQQRRARQEELGELYTAQDSVTPLPYDESARLKGLSYAREDQVVMRRILLAMRMMVDVLAAWPGYKALVYLGEGIPENPAQDYFLNDARTQLTSELGLLTQGAAAAGVTLHTISTSGLVASGSAEGRSTFSSGADIVQGGASRRSNALKKLAHGTGGMALESNDIVESFVDMESGSRGYYVIGYVPEGPPDGLYHSVTVKLTRPRVNVRYRRGFMRLFPEQAREKAVQAAHLLPEMSPDLGLDLSAVAGPVDAESRVVDLVLYLPAASVLFLPSDDRLAARLEVGFVALDEEGRETYRVARRVRIGLDPAHVARRRSLGLNFFSRVRVPAASQEVTAVVSDLQGNAISATRLTLAPPGRGDGAVLGLSTYAMDEESMWIEMGEPAGERAEEAAVSYTLGPALRTRFAADEPVVGGFKVPPTMEAAPRSLSLLIVKDNVIVRAQTVPAESAEGDTFRVDLPLQGLVRGDYVLHIRQPGNTGTIDWGSLPFQIVER